MSKAKGRKSWIKIENPSISYKEGLIQIRGRIAPRSLKYLKVGPYQRGVLTGKSVDILQAGAREGTLFDCELGLRGEEYIKKGKCIYLQNPTYIIDGLQRISAGKTVLEEGGRPYIDVVVWLNTSEESESARFEVVNSMQRKVPSSVLLRNRIDTHKSIETMYNLSVDSSCKMCGKVSWEHSIGDGLMTARRFISLAIDLHYRIGNASGRGSFDALVERMERIVSNAGAEKIRNNVKYFYEVIDDIWGIREITDKKGVAFIRAPFLTALALVLTRHSKFWKNGNLFVDTKTKEKLRKFSFDERNDSLTKGGDSSSEELYRVLVDYINFGKSKNKLVADLNGFQNLFINLKKNKPPRSF